MLPWLFWDVCINTGSVQVLVGIFLDFRCWEPFLVLVTKLEGIRATPVASFKYVHPSPQKCNIAFSWMQLYLLRTWWASAKSSASNHLLAWSVPDGHVILLKLQQHACHRGRHARSLRCIISNSLQSLSIMNILPRIDMLNCWQANTIMSSSFSM